MCINASMPLDVLLLPICWCWSPLTSPQPDTSPHCKTTDMGQCTRNVSVYSPSFRLVLNSTYPWREVSGWVGLGAWFCAEVVYPCIHPSTTYSNQRLTAMPNQQPGLICITVSNNRRIKSGKINQETNFTVFCLREITQIDLSILKMGAIKEVFLRPPRSRMM